MSTPLTYQTYFDDTVKQMSVESLKQKQTAFQKEKAHYQTMQKVYKLFTTSSTVFAALSLVAVAASAYHFRKIILLHAGIGLAAAAMSYCLSWVMRDQARKKGDQACGTNLLIEEITQIQNDSSNYQPINANFATALPKGIEPFDVFIVNQAYHRAVSNKSGKWDIEATAKAKKLDQFLIDANNQQNLV